MVHTNTKPNLDYIEWKKTAIHCQSVLAVWTLQSTFRPFLAFLASFSELINITIFMCHSFLLNTDWLLLYIDQNYNDFLWDWPFALCCLVSFLIKIYTYLKLLIEFSDEKKGKQKWMNSRKQKRHTIPTENLGKVVF